MAMSSVWRRQPGMTIYTLMFLCALFLRLPWVLVSYVFPCRRPNRHWTYRQAVSRTVVRSFGAYLGTVELSLPPSLSAGREKDRFVVVPPARPDMYRDIVRCDGAIRPGNVGAVWYAKALHRPGEHRPGQRVMMHFHAGAYLLGGARPIDVGYACGLLLRHSPPGTAVFCPEYRLAAHPGGRFPGALQDAVTCYAHLVFGLGIAPRDIVLSGSSAGGNLALALLRYANAHPDLLPEPAAVLLWSPWTDLSLQMDVVQRRPAMRVDIVPPEIPLWFGRVFFPDPETGVTGKNPYISPVMEAIPTRVPIWAQWGSAELLAEDILRFLQTQEGCCGIEVPNAPHDLLHAAPWLGWTKEAEDAVKDAMRFLNDQLPSAEGRMGNGMNGSEQPQALVQQNRPSLHSGPTK